MKVYNVKFTLFSINKFWVLLKSNCQLHVVTSRPNASSTSTTRGKKIFCAANIVYTIYHPCHYFHWDQKKCILGKYVARIVYVALSVVPVSRGKL